MPLHHAALSQDRWAKFSLDQQILMIANEMNRATQLLPPKDGQRLKNCYERILNLTNLTIRVQEKRTLRRELLRWRDLIAELYISPEANAPDHMAAFKCLLCFTPEAAKQRPYVLDSSSLANSEGSLNQ